MSISISSKKKDKDRDKDTKGASGIKASTDYTIGTAGEEVGITNIMDSPEVHSGTSDKVAIEDVTNKIEEEMISSSSPSYDNPPTEPTVATSSSSFDQYQYDQNYLRQREEQQSEINRALEETRDNIRKSTDEARKEIPRYTQAASQYQEQTIETAKEIADTLLESQKQILSSFQSAWLPYIDTANSVFTSNWMSPRQFSQIYANMVSNFADNMIIGTRLANSMMFANMEAFKTIMQQTRDNTKELSRSNANAAKSLERTSRDSARNVGERTSTSYTRGYTATEEIDQGREQRRF
jgi:vacuolar-type H+-ATPase subunit H